MAVLLGQRGPEGVLLGCHNTAESRYRQKAASWQSFARVSSSRTWTLRGLAPRCVLGSSSERPTRLQTPTSATDAMLRTPAIA